MAITISKIIMHVIFEGDDLLSFNREKATRYERPGLGEENEDPHWLNAINEDLDGLYATCPDPSVATNALDRTDAQKRSWLMSLSQEDRTIVWGAYHESFKVPRKISERDGTRRAASEARQRREAEQSAEPELRR